MTKLPVEHNNGVTDVTQLIVGQTSLQFVVKFFALFGLDGKLAQIADMAADTTGTQVEDDAKQQGKGNGKVNVGVIGLQRLRQLSRIGYGSTHDDVAKAGGRIEVGLVGGLRQTLDVVTIAIMQGLLDFGSLKMIA